MPCETSSSIVGAIRGAKNDTGQLVVPLLKKENITIGRAKSNTIVIRSEYVSRQHCRIYATESSEDSGIWMAYVEDLSEGMTWLNGVRIGKHNHNALYPGCTLTIADSSISFYFVGIGPLRKKWTRTTSMDWINGKKLVVSQEMVGQGSQSKIYLVGTTFPCRQQLVCRRTNTPRLLGPALTHHKQRLQNEVNILLSLHHPNVIRLLKYTINPDNTFSMIFPLVCGGTLKRYTNKGPGKKPLHELQIQFIMYQLLSAMKYIHSMGIIHRDLKPSNILVYKTRTPFPRIVVNDFGLSVNAKAEKQWSHSLGTRMYFAPEIAIDDASSAPFDFKADCWSLGIVLYQLFTHMFPYELKNNASTIDTMDEAGIWEIHREWVLNEHLDLKSNKIWSSVSISGKQLIHQLLEKNPKKRWSSQEAFDSGFAQVDFTKHHLLERQADIWHSYLDLVKWIKADNDVDADAAAASDAPQYSEDMTKRHSRHLPSIYIGTRIPVPGNNTQQDAFSNIIRLAPPPMHFENGKPIYPPPIDP